MPISHHCSWINPIESLFLLAKSDFHHPGFVGWNFLWHHQLCCSNPMSQGNCHGSSVTNPWDMGFEQFSLGHVTNHLDHQSPIQAVKEEEEEMAPKKTTLAWAKREASVVRAIGFLMSWYQVIIQSSLVLTVWLYDLVTQHGDLGPNFRIPLVLQSCSHWGLFSKRMRIYW